MFMGFYFYLHLEGLQKADNVFLWLANGCKYTQNIKSSVSNISWINPKMLSKNYSIETFKLDVCQGGL